jgi:serine/threonine-protein kinase mTOR
MPVLIFLRSLGIRMADELENILDVILSGQLRPTLVSALRETCVAVPAMRRNIQDGLLKILSLILLHRPLQHPGALLDAFANTPPIVEDVATTVLALKTLGTFDFEGVFSSNFL